MPSLPSSPSSPGSPGSPFAPSIPSLPGVPGVPGSPLLPLNPLIPGVPGAPGVPGVPSLPGLPGVPATPGAPVAPGVPAGPTGPGPPGIPGVPSEPFPPPTTGALAIADQGTFARHQRPPDLRQTVINSTANALRSSGGCEKQKPPSPIISSPGGAGLTVPGVVPGVPGVDGPGELGTVEDALCCAALMMFSRNARSADTSSRLSVTSSLPIERLRTVTPG